MHMNKSNHMFMNPTVRAKAGMVQEQELEKNVILDQQSHKQDKSTGATFTAAVIFVRLRATKTKQTTYPYLYESKVL